MSEIAAPPSLLEEDLDLVLAHTGNLWEELRGGRLFLTGGTGFFGTWLLETFCRANARLGLGATAVVLSRDPQAFLTKAPHFATDPAIRFHRGGVRSFVFPEGRFSHVIHAATPASVVKEPDPLVILDVIVEGTRRTLDLAVSSGAKKLLLTSSGAVYGPQPPELEHTPETHLGGPDTMRVDSAYGEGKRVAELLCAIYNSRYGIETKIARCFAFVGPHLPLDATFAIGNFIRDQLNGGPIVVSGDGTPRRSYLYAADLMVWLWTILFRGRACHPYNVGSEASLSIHEVASLVSMALPPPTAVHVGNRPQNEGPAKRYVPSTNRARTELDLLELTPLESGIVRTAQHYKAAGRGEAAGNPDDAIAHNEL